MVLDGTSQPGFALGQPVIELNGSLAGSGTRGLDIAAGGSTVRGLVINRFGESGMYLESGNGNTIQGNYIGTDPTGTMAEGNGTGAVLSVNDAITIEESSNNTIGGTSVGARNVISGNHVDGVLIFFGSMNNVFEGKFVETDVTGKKPLPNAYSGVRVDSTGNNTIGGTVPGAGNVISNNGQFGIFVVNSSPGTVIQGNLIGTDITGTQPLGNVSDGIVLATSATDEPSGGPPRARAIQSPITAATRSPLERTATDASTGNAVLGNSIFSNTGLGIDLGNNSGVTLNNSLGHTGPNNYQNFPVLTSVTPGTSGTTIAGSLNSTANTKYTIQFFANAAADPSGYGEGKTYLGQTIVTTDAAGNASFSAVVAPRPADNRSSAHGDRPCRQHLGVFQGHCRPSRVVAFGRLNVEPIDLWQVGDIHGHRQRFQRRRAYRQRRVLRRNERPWARDSLDRQRNECNVDVEYREVGGWNSLDQGRLHADGSFAGSTGTLTQTVNQAVLTVSGITALNKVYIANTTAALNTSGAKLLGVVSGDTVNLGTSSATGTFASRTWAAGSRWRWPA